MWWLNWIWHLLDKCEGWCISLSSAFFMNQFSVHKSHRASSRLLILVSFLIWGIWYRCLAKNATGSNKLAFSNFELKRILRIVRRAFFYRKESFFDSYCSILFTFRKIDRHSSTDRKLCLKRYNSFTNSIDLFVGMTTFVLSPRDKSRSGGKIASRFSERK